MLPLRQDVAGGSTSRTTTARASREYWDALSGALKPIYQAGNAEVSAAAMDPLEQRGATRYSAMMGLWRTAWSESIPFLDYDLKIRRVICSATPSSP